MKLAFTKMHGAGNDFVVIDATKEPFALSRAQLQRLADRHLGVGCDQVLVVENPTRGDVDFRYRIFNADGGEVEQCGNGARCFVKFVRDRGLTAKREIRVETPAASSRRSSRTTARSASTWACRVLWLRRCRSPRLGASPTRRARRPRVVDLGAVDGQSARGAGRRRRRSGAGHDKGPRIEHHPRFPRRVNAGYMQVIDRATIRLRVWERGAGERSRARVRRGRRRHPPGIARRQRVCLWRRRAHRRLAGRESL
jgi:diaminopimelate epimerase